MAAILREVGERKVHRLGIEPLGCVYGRLPVERFLTLLRNALTIDRPASLDRIWLISPPELLDSLAASVP